MMSTCLCLGGQAHTMQLAHRPGDALPDPAKHKSPPGELSLFKIFLHLDFLSHQRLASSLFPSILFPAPSAVIHSCEPSLSFDFFFFLFLKNHVCRT